MKILSILICSLPDRKHHLVRLMDSLKGQLTDEVEVLIDDCGRSLPTGTKRNNLIMRATGQYVVFIDDDDDVSSVYIPEVLKYIKNGYPDCVTFEGWMTTNSANRVDWIIKLGEKYEARRDSDGITRYYRFPNHIVPIKKSIARAVKFMDIWQGEDYKWAKQINDMGLIKTSNHIPLKLYHYKFITHK